MAKHSTRIRLTSKRQATFPVAMCKELGLKPGDEVTLERGVRNGEVVWVLRQAEPATSWIGSLSRYARGKSHKMERIRESVGRAIGRGRR